MADQFRPCSRRPAVGRGREEEGLTPDALAQGQHYPRRTGNLLRASQTPQEQYGHQHLSEWLLGQGMTYESLFFFPKGKKALC